MNIPVLTNTSTKSGLKHPSFFKNFLISLPDANASFFADAELLTADASFFLPPFLIDVDLTPDCLRQNFSILVTFSVYLCLKLVYVYQYHCG